jgi:hypothetical protein
LDDNRHKTPQNPALQCIEKRQKTQKIRSGSPFVAGSWQAIGQLYGGASATGRLICPVLSAEQNGVPIAHQLSHVLLWDQPSGHQLLIARFVAMHLTGYHFAWI